MDKIPTEILFEIFEHIKSSDFQNIRCVSRKFKNIIEQRELFEVELLQEKIANKMNNIFDSINFFENEEDMKYMTDISGIKELINQISKGHDELKSQIYDYHKKLKYGNK